MKPGSWKNSAITLLEITVLIAIIAVLAALLMPALGRARDQAKATMCANNMRQLLVARQSWVAENDGGMIPPYPLAPGDPTTTWRLYLNQKYGIPTKAFKCPSAPSASQESASDLASNYAALGDRPWNNTVSVASIEHGSQQLVLLETRGTSCVLLRSDWKAPPMSDGKGIIGYWHNYKTTCGYADGHIELKKLGQTVTPVCEWDTVPTIYDGQSDPN